ncbi:MAG: C_GCAxxG_C_C family protein [Myxococcales bacterium]|nr:C_GCAxxG_C_C family protein [Myxococcales bacterium]
MTQTKEPPNDSKQVFRECGTCSQTFAHLVDRSFGEPRDVHERALTRLAGGIANHGHQCGMLWGATLGVGAEAARRCDDRDEAIGLALAATQHVVASFVERTHTVRCREITGHNLTTIRGLAGLMYDTIRHGMDNSPCFNLAEDWTPEALEAARAGLASAEAPAQTPRSCASEVVLKMGGSDEEAVMVAGFAGGLGLSGDACGALGAAIWMKGLAWCRAHPDKSPGPWTDTGDRKTLAIYEEFTAGEYSCKALCGRTFADVDEHAAFIEAGGCSGLIEALARS